MAPFFPDFIHNKAQKDLLVIFEEQGCVEQFAVGDYLLPLGSLESKCFLLDSGHCIFICEQETGMSRSCGIVPPGGMAGLGPIMTQLTKRPEEINLMCLEPVHARSVPIDSFRNYCQSQPSLNVVRLQHIIATMSSLYSTLLFQLTLNLPQRLAYFLRFYTESLGILPDSEGWVDLPLRLTHERLGAIISASRVTTTLLQKHLERLNALKQTKQGLYYAAWLTEVDFILNKLNKKAWTVARKKE